MIPPILAHMTTKIYKEVLFKIKEWRLAQIKPAKKRKVIPIIGDSLAGKTKLGELILQHMASKGVFDIMNTGSVGGFKMEGNWPRM